MRVIREFVLLPALLLATAWSPAQAQVQWGQASNVSRDEDGNARAARLIRESLTAATGLETEAVAVEGSLTGLVTDALSGRPLSSAQVFIEGTGRGGLTNATGRYLIVNVPAGEYTLRVELIGYTGQSQQITVVDNQATTVDFQLEEEALALDEIVVTGTAGQARRREVGNTIAQVKVAEVAEPVTNVGALLQSRVPGALIQFGSGNAGSGPDIRLRGNVSVSLSNQPLIYIDGIRTMSEPTSTQNGAEDPYSPLNDLNPDDIERIEVVKGPAATTLYGTEAAAGVIQIFTKRGGQGAPQWTAEVQQGFSYFRPFGTDEVPHLWLDQVFRKGHRQRYSMSVQGGTDAVGYFVSGAYDDNLDPVETGSEERMGARANTTFRPHEDLLIQFNNSLTVTNLQQAQMGNSVTSIMMTAIRGPRNYMSGRRDQETLRLLLEEEYKNRITRVTSGLTVNYTPGSDFTHRLSVGYDLAQDDNFNDQPYCWLCPIGILSDFSDYIQGGEIRRGFSNTRIWSVDYVGTLGFDLFSNVRNTLSFGAQGVQTDHENGENVGRHFPGVGDYTLSSAATRQSFRQNKLKVITGGFFAQNQFGISDRYFLTVGVRVDGNSAFGENLGFQVYPKVSGSYVISDEDFWPENFGEVKLRGAYGLAGRAPGAFDKVRTWDPVGFGSSGQAFYPDNIGNDDLGPERTSEYEFGLDGGWFDGRLSAEFTYYKQTTSDALFEVSPPDSEGGWDAQLENVGKLQNSGIEIQTNATLLNSRALRWDLGLGLATNESKVLDLGGTAPFSLGNGGWVIEGEPVPVIYAYRVMNFNELADPIISEGREIYGPNNPTHHFSASTSFGLPGGLQLSARGEYIKGGYMYNYFEAGALSRTIANPGCYDAYRKADPSWVPGELGSNTPPPRPATRPADMYAWEMANCFGMATFDHSTSESDYAELRDVTLSIPISSLLPSLTGLVSRADLTISGRNLAYWRHKNIHTGHPEMQESTEGPSGNSGTFQHNIVRAMREQLPPQSHFTVSLRAVF